MGTRGRKSTAELSIVQGDFGRKPPPEPPNMPPFAVDLWKRIVKELPTEHFRESDLPLLKSYCWAAWQADASQRMLLSDGINADKAMFALHQSAIRDMAQIATKLRLCPSTRMRAESAALKKTNPAKKPWEA